MGIRTRLSPGRRGVLLGILVGGVPPGSPNPDPISDQNIPGGDSAYERGGDARRKFWIKPLKETDLGVAQAFFTHKRDHVNYPKGRWRVGGGIDVPVKIEMEAARSSIRELKDELWKLGKGQESNNNLVTIFRHYQIIVLCQQPSFVLYSCKTMDKDVFFKYWCYRKFGLYDWSK